MRPGPSALKNRAAKDGLFATYNQRRKLDGHAVVAHLYERRVGSAETGVMSVMEVIE